MNPKVLIADDEAGIRRVITLLLKDHGYEVKAVSNGREAVDSILSFRPDVILLDQQMPVLTGTDALEEIKKIDPEQVILFITAFGSISFAVDTVKMGAYDFIEKPFDNDNLLFKVGKAVEHSRMKHEIKSLKSKLRKNARLNIVGENSGLRQVVAQLKRVAETNATVLIHGESGTGKELISKAIHTHSSRSDAPFVAVNCGAIPLSLMESELFGFEKGAFTDAKEAQAGIFERANGGTLFLDEIGELPMDAQVKLLRVLEDKKIRRIGGKKEIGIDLRIVAATNRNLEEEVQKGNFRLDLLYRLNVFTLSIPALRERREDIPLLVDFFIAKHNETLGLSVHNITQKAMERITSYDWPGNVRDLENAIQSAMILSMDGVIHEEQLPTRIKGYEPAELFSYGTETGTIREMNAQVEKEVIVEALKSNNFNRTLTAEALNISRKTLFNKMKRYGINT